MAGSNFPEVVFYVLADHLVVRRVAQVNDCLRDITHSGSGLLQQGFDVLQHPLRLLYDVAGIDDLAFVVDAGRS